MSARSKNESMNMEGNKSKSNLNSSKVEDQKNKAITYVFNGHKNQAVGFDEVFKIYKFKLHKLKRHSSIKNIIEKFWNLLNRNFEGEIEKECFINLFRKIYRVILPYFNHGEIYAFLEGEWLLINKGYLYFFFNRKTKSLNYKIFKRLFCRKNNFIINPNNSQNFL